VLVIHFWDITVVVRADKIDHAFAIVPGRCTTFCWVFRFHADNEAGAVSCLSSIRDEFPGHRV
jgi:hypothetical protein